MLSAHLMTMNKREFLKAFGAGAVAAATNKQVFAHSQWNPSQLQSFDPSVINWGDDPYVVDLQRGQDRFQIDLRTKEGYRIASYLLRDIRAGRQGYPHIEMLRLVAWAQAWLAAYDRFTVIKITSGLRTKATNSSTEGAARNSRHLPNPEGVFYAMDVDPYGVDRNYFGQLISTPRFGGVGWYPHHIHFDIRNHPAYWVKK